MHTRIFFGTIQSDKSQEALAVLNDFVDRAKQLPGCLLAQLMQNGSEIVGISTWATKEDLASYAESELARELFSKITPLFMGRPTVRSYEVKRSLSESAIVKSFSVMQLPGGVLREVIED